MSPQDRDRERNQHPSDDSLLDYVEDRAPEQVAIGIEAHFSVCDACVRLARKLRLASSAVEDWTAAKHALVIEAIAIETALRFAETDAANFKWRERLQLWRAGFGARAQGAVRVAVKASREATLEVAREMKSLLVPGGWEFVPAAMARSSDVKVLEIRGAPETRFAVTDETSPDGRKTWVVTLTLPEDLGGGTPLLAMVIDVAEPEKVVITDALAAEGMMTAVFRGLPPGEYIAIIEPKRIF